MASLKKNGSNKILQTVEKTIITNKLFQPGDRVLIAVSGGQDSVLLLHVLSALASQLSISPGIAHLNHGIRGQEAKRDSVFVEQLAQRFGMPFFYKKENVEDYSVTHRLSLEEAGRVVRYKFFRQIMTLHGYSRLALGHHADDNSEQVLMYLLRGSGPLGASGIRPVRDGGVVRPLINIYRTDIEAYVRENRLKYVEDTSNLDTRFVRNRVRHELIPLLASGFNKNVKKSLNRFASILSCEDEWIEKIIQPEFDRVIVNKDTGKFQISNDIFKTFHLALKRRILRKIIALVKGDLRRIRFDHIDAIIMQVEKTGYAEHHLPGQIRVIFESQCTIFQKEKKTLRSVDPVYKENSSYYYTIDLPGTIQIREINATISLSEMEKGKTPDFSSCGKDTVFFDMDAMTFPLIIRTFVPGDRFIPLGMKGSQKVKKYFIDHKVSRLKRATVPIVLSADRIIWVAGHRIDNSVKVNPDTKRILKAEFFLPNTLK
ncbi:MAG: tRNA lysidine(34) synthetase TilS [Desulfobacterales bacterium]|nr:tRNA lysidine(34) synthetase TilS [Desulfobacterales bacterium]